MTKYYVTAIGYGIAVVLAWLLLNAREDLGEIREQCNTDKALAVAEAEKVVKEAQEAAHKRQLLDLERRHQQEREGRVAADLARSEAERQARSVQEEIDRLINEARNNEDAAPSEACLDITVPNSAVERLR